MAIAALVQDKKALVGETADLLYHLLVVLESRGVDPRRGVRRAGAAHGAYGGRRKEAKDRVALTGERFPMNPRPHVAFSPYIVYLREEWAGLRADTPMPLTEAELDNLSSLTERVSAEEVVDIYLPLSRLLNLYVEAAQGLHGAPTSSCARATARCRSSSVLPAASPSARAPRRACSRRCSPAGRVTRMWSSCRPTDSSFPMRARDARVDEPQGLSRELRPDQLLNFLAEVKSGKDARRRRRVYSHLVYDVTARSDAPHRAPDIVIVEGLNVLQPAKLPKDGEAIPFVSDFFDFSIYIDAADDMIESWYVERFLRLGKRRSATPPPTSTAMPCCRRRRRVETGLSIWRSINLINLTREHPAHAPARRSHPAQRRRSRGRDRGPQETLIAASSGAPRAAGDYGGGAG